MSIMFQTVGQPSTVPHTTIVQPQPRANEYLILTLVLMALCFIHGNLPAFICLVPALICSCVVSDYYYYDIVLYKFSCMKCTIVLLYYYYSGTPLNSKVTPQGWTPACDIMDNSECPDCISIDFNILFKPSQQWILRYSV